MSSKIQLTPYLDIDLDKELWCCHQCGFELISARQNYKEGCLVHARDPRTLRKPATGSEYDFSPSPDWCRLVEFYCPGCGAMLEVEPLPPGHPITHDIELDIDGLKARYSGQKTAK